MRTVTLQFDENFGSATEGNRKEVEGGIGYLSTWTVHSPRYTQVDLFGDKDGNLHANYRDGTTREITYHLFGLRREDGTYSFHS